MLLGVLGMTQKPVLMRGLVGKLFMIGLIQTRSFLTILPKKCKRSSSRGLMLQKFTLKSGAKKHSSNQVSEATEEQRLNISRELTPNIKIKVRLLSLTLPLHE